MTNPLLLYGDQHDPNFVHISGFNPPDKQICLKLHDKTILLCSDLEYSRAVKECECTVELSSKYGKSRMEQIKTLLAQNNVTNFDIAEGFSCGLYKELVDLNMYTISILDGPLPTRRTKTMKEIKLIDDTNAAVCICFGKIRQILKESKIGDNNVLMYNGSVLTSEYLKQVVEIECIMHSCRSDDTIIACGEQGTDPHCQGTGPIYANQLIVCDIFPSHKLGYFGDMTRTFLKGTPTPQQIKLYETVYKCQDMCVQHAKVGMCYGDVAKLCASYLEQSGYKMEFRKEQNRFVGMNHGLGHGVGLEIHENPRVNQRSTEICQPFDCFTIEPGLYYPEIGGVRIEDSLWVDEDGDVKKFAGFDYDWVIE